MKTNTVKCKKCKIEMKMICKGYYVTDTLFMHDNASMTATQGEYACPKCGKKTVADLYK